ncbi:Mrp family chromosome partitioning ATPase [Desulfitispora alkaliphila]|uniref:hypothetical protein n=1 Tax=Desulfitispora alkaliphila TaxID=622674 RepID=UPI003D20EE47
MACEAKCLGFNTIGLLKTKETPVEVLTEKVAQYILKHLSQNFDYVVIDIGPENHGVLGTSLSAANKAFLVVDYDISTISIILSIAMIMKSISHQ